VQTLFAGVRVTGICLDETKTGFRVKELARLHPMAQQLNRASYVTEVVSALHVRHHRLSLTETASLVVLSTVGEYLTLAIARNHEPRTKPELFGALGMNVSRNPKSVLFDGYGAFNLPAQARRSEAEPHAESLLHSLPATMFAK